jgi:4'-phosphopantetheinyl transferase
MNILAVHTWPGPTPTPQDGLFALLIPTTPSTNTLPGTAATAAAHRREAARLLLRRAAREALAAVLRVPAADITITSRPGQPPSILLANRPSSIGISFSHEEGYALAAINLHGAIGVDLMRIQDIPDWQAVARDYLGPAAAAALQASDDRPRAFAKAWTRREAALKCHAQQLSEWQADLPGQSIPLALPVAELTAHIHRC